MVFWLELPASQTVSFQICLTFVLCKSNTSGTSLWYRAFQVACNARTAMQLQHVIKLKLSSQQFGHVTASASCKQPEKHGRPDC